LEQLSEFSTRAREKHTSLRERERDLNVLWNWVPGEGGRGREARKRSFQVSHVDFECIFSASFVTVI
jgi:hypothetical protein